ncbi:Terminase [Streptomyces sp. NBC_01017]|uniref:Terminase n=1 Tax=Streptomyces sp. NBC_01017 TaxID=2903721 RepID=UPI00386F8EA7|nr:Terminase [Streptomyces sp. NBC_01017]
MPRELVRAPEHDRHRSLGWLALAWKEHFCVHGPGDIQGRPLDPDDPDGIPLDDELAALTVDAYALDGSGRRLYDSAFFSRAKGRDKSGTAGRFVLFEAFGPCRFAGFAEGGEVYRWRDFEYVYEPGEPMGRPVTYPFIRCLATEESQAGNTYDNVLFNLTDGPLGEDLPGDAAGVTRIILPDGGEIVPSTASNAAKDGGKESFVVFDETHLYVLPELRRMYDTVRRNLGKRKDASPWSLETSTMYAPGAGSVAEETHLYAKLIREGKTRTARLLFDHRSGFEGVDLTDECAVRESLVESYGDFAGVMDLDRLVNEIFDPRNSPSDSRRYFFNLAEAAADAWLAEPELIAVSDLDKVVADGEMITLGFDGSRKRSRKVTDATALIGCRVSDGHLFELGVWEQPAGAAGENWEVPKAEVLAAVEDAFARFNVVGFYADPAKWQEHVMGWEARYGNRLEVKASRTHPVEWWMTGGRAIQIVRATQRLLDAILEREMTYDGSYALTRHFLNARRREGRTGIQIMKENPDSPRKIDAAVASILAFEARSQAVAQGLAEKAEPMGGFTF